MKSNEDWHCLSNFFIHIFWILRIVLYAIYEVLGLEHPYVIYCLRFLLCNNVSYSFLLFYAAKLGEQESVHDRYGWTSRLKISSFTFIAIVSVCDML